MLWNKDLPLDEAVHRFTVGDDPTVDLEILAWDALASAAHVKGLAKIGALPWSEARQLVDALRLLHQKAQRQELTIPRHLEDGHTLLESELTERLGEPGKKIHLGRSRNDQVATAIRLWMRAAVTETFGAVADLSQILLAFHETYGELPMPGYSHLRAAMPSSLGQWTVAYAEALIESQAALVALDERLDRCPLGTGAGYGVPLGLDRDYVANELGFSDLHLSPIDVQNSRGRLESAVAHEFALISGIVEKLAQDLWLFTSDEFGFFALPDSFTTGSSIMPQKRNPDVVELLRARCREIRGHAHTLDLIAMGLPGGYHRDFQLLKAPLFATQRQLNDALRITALVVEVLKPVEERLLAAMKPELYATEVAYERVAEGLAFRDAYREVAQQVLRGELERPTKQASNHVGAVGDPGWNRLQDRARALGYWLERRHEAQAETLERAFHDWPAEVSA